MKFFAVFTAIIVVGAAYPTTWSLQELDAALRDPTTDPAIIPYLEAAMNKLMAAIFNGQQIETIVVHLPDGLDKPEINPSPAIVDETEPANPKPFAGPLVQVIVNIIKVAGTPAIVPTPVDVSENEAIENTPIAPIIPDKPAFNPIDVIAINPEPIDGLQPADNGILV